ncbi:hypothetical protein M0P65_05435 [Candidatus Gracilibacteria bacterium]|nr:hypothetical protein [Candidatus Gracilibacteria bacterium]
MISYHSFNYLEIQTTIPGMTPKKQKEYLVNEYTNKLLPFSNILKEKYQEKNEKWITREKQETKKINLRDISRIRKELDSFTTKLQSVELLTLYLIAENLERNLNNGKLQEKITKKLSQYDNAHIITTISGVPSRFMGFVNPQPDDSEENISFIRSINVNVNTQYLPSRAQWERDNNYIQQWDNNDYGP